MTLCSPWLDPADLHGQCNPQTPNILTAIEAASEILYQLTGRQFPGICTRTVWPCSQSSAWVAPSHLHPLPTSGFCSHNYLDCGCEGVSAIRLNPGPIVAIDEITIDGVVLDPSEYLIDSRTHLIRLRDSDGFKQLWPSCNDLSLPSTEPGTFTITYQYGRRPPQIGILAANQLACELAKSLNSDSSCALPPNVQQISRQGLTYLLTSLDDIKSGFTGLGGVVDQFISAYNPHRIQSAASVFSPDTHKSFRHRS